MRDPVRALIVSGGPTHDFDATSAELVALLADQGVASTITTDVEEAFVTLGATTGTRSLPHVLVVNALRWQMLADRYAHQRAEFAIALSPTARSAFERWLGDGGRLLAMHTAVICFDDWPEWGDALGAAWQWDHSSHPPYGPIRVAEAPGAPLHAHRGAGKQPAGAFVLADEAYSCLDHRVPLDPWLTVTADGVEDPQPAMWARQVDRGRVFVDTLGHDIESLRHPDHRAWLAIGLRWLLQDGADCAPAEPLPPTVSNQEGPNHAFT